MSKLYTVLDIETSGLEINSTINFIGIHTFTTPEDAGTYYIYDMSEQKEECIKHLLKIKGFIGHNAKFDAKIIKYNLDIDLTIAHDTMYLCYMCSTVHDLIYKRGKWLSLKHAAMRDLGVDSWDIDLASKKSNDKNKVVEYLKKDLKYTRRLFELYKDRIEEVDYQTYFLMIKAANVYKDVEGTGMPINLDQLNKTMSEYNIKLIDVDVKLKKFADINYNSPKQLSKLLFEDYKLKCNIKSSTGKQSTGVEAMEQLRGQHEIIDLILEKRGLEKAVSFLKDWKERQINGRIYGNFNLHTTVTGRTSSNGPEILGH